MSRIIIISCFKIEVIFEKNFMLFQLCSESKTMSMFDKLESKIFWENLISKSPKGHIQANEEDKFNEFIF